MLLITNIKKVVIVPQLAPGAKLFLGFHWARLVSAGDEAVADAFDEVVSGFGTNGEDGECGEGPANAIGEEEVQQVTVSGLGSFHGSYYRTR